MTRIALVQQGVAICYDRHLPEYMGALALGGADLVVVPQAGVVGEWPEGLFEAEMRVAAFQNDYFVGLCNRVGADGALTFAGESFVCRPEGTILARAPQGAEHITVSNPRRASSPERPAHARTLLHSRSL
jgi:N-carbamoylputrescine amidase